MTTDNWEQFKDIFQTALELAPKERAAYLYRACPEKSSRAELEALLLCYSPASASGQTAIIHGLTERPSEPEIRPRDPLVESFLDHYQIVEKLAESEGWNQYLATPLHDQLMKQVVVTTLTETAPAAEFWHFFKRERAILLNLHHPYVATFLDTGTTRDGLPYFATENTHGLAIEEYCDSARLNMRDRIQLFLGVCDAIQFAHQHLIAHGSMHPRNIVVLEQGTPKILNLALAVFLYQGKSFAKDSIDIECVSPARTRGETIRTGDDVYSLGVLLYRLLTGHSPYGMKTEREGELVPFIFEAVRPSKVIYHSAEHRGRDGKKITVNPEKLNRSTNAKLRTVRKALAGDLDSIILKAIQRDPAKRYATVDQFSRDIRLHLDGRIVSARQATFFYRASKFLKV